MTAGLAARGWALATVPTQPTVTAAGVISTGSHNTARDAPATVADQVAAVEALDASGAPYSFKGDELKAARVGLGALGPILRVTLRCVPAFDLLHAWAERGADEAFTDLDALMRKHDHLWLNWKLLANDEERVVIRSADRISGAPPQVTRISSVERVPAWQRVAARATVKLAARIPALKPALMGSIAAKRSSAPRSLSPPRDTNGSAPATARAMFTRPLGCDISGSQQGLAADPNRVAGHGI